MYAFRAAVIVFCVLLCSQIRAQDYSIKIVTSFKPNDQYKLSCSGESSEEVLLQMGDQVINQEKSVKKAELVCIVKVLTVDKYGRETGVELDVTEFKIATDANQPAEVALTKGAKVVAKISNGEELFTVDGKPVPKKTQAALSQLISLAQMSVTDDQIFGTKDRKKVGDTWKIQADLLAKGFAKGLGLTVSPKDVEGKSTLEKVIVIDGVKCLQVKGCFTIKNLTPTIPDTMKMVKSTMNASFYVQMPVDANDRSSVSLSEGQTMSFDFTATGKVQPDRPDVTMTVKSRNSVIRKTKPLQ